MIHAIFCILYFVFIFYDFSSITNFLSRSNLIARRVTDFTSCTLFLAFFSRKPIKNQALSFSSISSVYLPAFRHHHRDIHSQVEDKRRASLQSARIDSMIVLNSGMRDDYELSKQLRRRFRGEKKSLAASGTWVGQMWVGFQSYTATLQIHRV
jgi:hypothetical protein